MAKRSFIDEASPNLPTKRVIPWPMGGPRKVVVRALGDDVIEQAYFAAKDHFKAKKIKVDFTDPGFTSRERVEIVFRAFAAVDEDGTETDETIAASVDALAKYPKELINTLHAAWFDYQREANALPVNDTTVSAIIEDLKKNTPAEAYSALPSTWLIAVITGLVAPHLSSPTENGSG